jgi:hypothetical protein
MLLASDFDQSKYLKAADLPHEKKFRIKHVTEEQIGLGPDKERKLVVWFTNDQRGLVLNRTNNRAIRGAYGDNTDGWVGKIVVIFSTNGRLPREDDPCLAGAHPAAEASHSSSSCSAAAGAGRQWRGTNASRNRCGSSSAACCGRGSSAARRGGTGGSGSGA